MYDRPLTHNSGDMDTFSVGTADCTVDSHDIHKEITRLYIKSPANRHGKSPRNNPKASPRSRGTTPRNGKTTPRSGKTTPRSASQLTIENVRNIANYDSNAIVSSEATDVFFEHLKASPHHREDFAPQNTVFKMEHQQMQCEQQYYQQAHAHQMQQRQPHASHGHGHAYSVNHSHNNIPRPHQTAHQHYHAHYQPPEHHYQQQQHYQEQHLQYHSQSQSPVEFACSSDGHHVDQSYMGSASSDCCIADEDSLELFDFTGVTHSHSDTEHHKHHNTEHVHFVLPCVAQEQLQQQSVAAPVMISDYDTLMSSNEEGSGDKKEEELFSLLSSLFD
eukprot:gene199-274_t